MIKTTEWKTTKGANVVVTAKLILKKTVNLDGDKVEVDCCEMGLITAEIDGFPTQAGFDRYLAPKDHPQGFKVFGAVGKLGITEDNIVKVDGIIAELKQHPAWIATQTKIEKNMKEIAEMKAARKANGYCEKCGSYCYGDCDAN